MARATTKKKSSDDKVNKQKVLNWSLPGHAKSTVFFTTTGIRPAVHVTLYAATSSDSAEALIAGERTKDDILDIEHFDKILFEAPDAQKYIYAIIANLSEEDIELDLAFMFAGTSIRGQNYPLTVPKLDFISVSIPVKISRS